MMKSTYLNALFLIASISLVALLTTCSEAQQMQKNDSAAAAFDPAEAHKAVENLAKQLEDNFIYPAVGKSYASMLRSKVASGAYSKFATAAEFAEVVTRDLQAVNPDGHLSLRPPVSDAERKSGNGSSRGSNGVGKYGWLSPGVAYLSYNGFSGDRAAYDKALAKLREVLDGFATAKTLILDIRSHPGGGLDDMDVMFSYFFDKPTTLVMMDTRLAVEQRGGSPLSGHPTLKSVEGPEGIVRRAHIANPLGKEASLSTAKIFLLTSKRTASAAEHLSLSLKRTGRATLIGEKTSGAGHFGRSEDLGGGYRAFIPVGRTFDPDTDKGWEQTGIEPHIAVPAADALDAAIERAGADREKAKKALETLSSN